MSRAQTLALEIARSLNLSGPEIVIHAEVALIAGKLAPLFEALEYALAGPRVAISQECKTIGYVGESIHGKGHHCASCWIDEVRRLAGQALSKNS